MKRQKVKRRLIIENLYFSYYLQRSTIILLLIILILVPLFLYIICNIDTNTYLKDYNDYHNIYLSNSCFIIQLLNLVIISCFTILICNRSNDFDKLFICNLSRKSIAISKLLVLIIIMFMINVIEYLILLGLAYYKYDYFIISPTRLYELAIIFYITITDLMLSIGICSLINTIFTPFFILFINILIKLVAFLYKDSLKEFINYFQIIIVNNGYIALNDYFIGIILIIIFFLIYFFIFINKDIK